jgi:VWFA-related protein
MTRTCLASLLAAAVAVPSPAQVPTFPSEAQLVYVRFHIEKKGSFVTEVAREQLRVLEDGKPQPIALLETPAGRDRTIRPEVTLMLDVSGSVMDDRLLDEALVRQVLLGGLGAGATVGVCAFAGTLECFAEPSGDAAAVLDGFARAIRFGMENRRSGTRLYASVSDVAKQAGARGARAQRAMILFTDALDNQGGKIDEAIDAAVAADVRVYAIKVSQAFQDTAGRSPFGGGPPPRTMYDYKKLELDALPDETGGRSFEPGTLDEASLGKILGEIAAEISREVVVGYEPQGPPTGKKRKVKVELVDKSLGKIPDGERSIVR